LSFRGRVYIFAHYLDYLDLKEVAQARFTCCFKSNLRDPTRVVQAVEHILANTSVNDTELRAQIVKICAEWNAFRPIKSQDLKELLEEYEPVAWHLQKAIAASYAESQEKVRQLTKDNTNLKSKVDRYEEEAKQLDLSHLRSGLCPWCERIFPRLAAGEAQETYCGWYGELRPTLQSNVPGSE
jgi:DNA repair exonuclease SbcCD ATPase subunit